MKTLKISKKTDRTKDERSKETNSEEYNRKKMAKKRPLSGGKKDEGSGTKLDRSEGCRGARTGTTRRAPVAREDAKRNRALEERADTDRTLERNGAPKGGRMGLNRPWDPAP